MSKEQQSVSEDENITPNMVQPMYVDITNHRLHVSNILHNGNSKSVILEEELSSTTMQAAVGNNSRKL